MWVEVMALVMKREIWVWPGHLLERARLLDEVDETSNCGMLLVKRLSWMTSCPMA